MIDSHCHLADEAFAGDLEAVVGRAQAAGVEGALCILSAGDAKESAAARRVRALWPDVRFSLGIHPHKAGEFAGRLEDARASVRRGIVSEGARAIGEIGLGCPTPAKLHDRIWASYCDELSMLKAVKLVDAHVPPQNIAYRINSVEGLSAAVSAGLGAGYLPCMVGDLIPSLMRIGPLMPELADPLWLLTHPDLRKTGRVHTFLEYCATALGKQRAFIEGRSGAAPAPRKRRE